MSQKDSIQKNRFDLAIQGDRSAVRKLLQKKPKHKYGAIAKEYNGVLYPSTKEADHAIDLDLKIKAKIIKHWERQITYKLVVNGVLVCKYILDFKEYYTDGKTRHVDVKGYKKGQAFAIFQLKQKLMKAIYNIDVELA